MSLHKVKEKKKLAFVLGRIHADDSIASDGKAQSMKRSPTRPRWFPGDGWHRRRMGALTKLQEAF